MNKLLEKLDKFSMTFMSILIILFSLSCDESEPTSYSTPDLAYDITILSQVRHCEQVSCIDDVDDEAYGADVACETDCEDNYHLYFQIKLTDLDDDAVGNATLVIEECPAIYSEQDSEDAVLECSGEITSSDFVSFTGEKVTNDEGIVEGYWKDGNESGNFIITVGYEDQYENDAETSYNILIHPMGELVNNLSFYTDPEIIFIDDEADQDTTQYSVDIIATLMDDNYIVLANVPVNFSITNDNAPATLSIANALTDSEGNCTTTANILKNEIENIYRYNNHIEFYIVF